MYHFVYRTTNNINGKYYVGVHNTEDLNDGYLGSGKLLLQAISKYGRSNFRREILQFFDNETDAFNYEAELVTENEVNNPNCYNLTLGGFGNGNMLFKSNGKIVINNGEQIKYIWPNELEQYENKGWAKGSLSKYSPLGKITIHKGSDIKMVKPNRLDYWLKQGWVKGRPELEHIWVTRNQENKMIKPDELDSYIEKGWKRGQYNKPNSKMNWMNKDGVSIRVYDKDIPEYIEKGWKRGAPRNSKPTKDKIRIKKNGSYKYIKPEEYQIYLSNGWQKAGIEMNGSKFTTKDTTWVNNGVDTKLINIKDLDEYLNEGWVRGTLNHSTIGRIKINNGIVEKLIDPNDLQKYLNEGWVKGKKKRGPK